MCQWVLSEIGGPAVLILRRNLDSRVTYPRWAHGIAAAYRTGFCASRTSTRFRCGGTTSIPGCCDAVRAGLTAFEPSSTLELRSYVSSFSSRFEPSKCLKAICRVKREKELRTHLVPDGQHVVEEQMTGYGQVDCLRSRPMPTKLSGFKVLPSMRADPSSVLKSRLPALGPRLPLKVSIPSSAKTNDPITKHAKGSNRRISTIYDVAKLTGRKPRTNIEGPHPDISQAGEHA